jgi:hypothetical protein
MSKPIIVIDAFLNKSEKNNILISNLQKFKKFNIPILLIGNKPISIEIQNEVDYFIYDKQNLLFKDSYYCYESFWSAERFEDFIVETRAEYKQEHGLSVLCNLTKSINFVKNLGFTKLIHFEWDLFIDDDDHEKYNNLINNFINSNEKAFFVGTSEISFIFWMIDIPFFNNKFPQILNEQDYKKSISNLNQSNIFLKVEKLFFIIFHDILNEKELINEDEFAKNNITKSISLYFSDFNYEKPNTKDAYQGLCKINQNSVLQNKLLIFTFNHSSEKEIDIEYYITFDNNTQYFRHTAKNSFYFLSEIKDFDFSKFPIELKTSCGFQKIYNSIDDIKNKMDHK